MADPICRWRYALPENLFFFINILPQKVMRKDDFRSIIEERYKGFLTTAYQLAKQMGLYYEDDEFYYPRFLNPPTYQEAIDYLIRWAMLYYSPNPYTKSIPGQVSSKLIYAQLCKVALMNDCRGTSIADYSEQIFGIKDIGNYDAIAKFINANTDLYIDKNKIVTFKEGMQPHDADLSGQESLNRDDAKMFFDYFGVSSGKLAAVTPKKNFSSEYRSYISAIKSKPFILLAGISGTGKSRIVRQLAYATGGENPDKIQKPYNYEMIQVRPNWHDSTELLGYETRISGEAEYIVTDFLRFLVKAWYYENIPFFLCLDEMNLAPVEQYFAEYLSVLETRKLRGGKIVSDPLLPALNSYGKKKNGSWIGDLILDDCFGKDWKIDGASVEKSKEKEVRLREQFRTTGIALPPNLIVMGTVNMDETTFSFSRKVLDRAMTIEMNDVDFYSGLSKDNCLMAPITSEIILPDAVEAMDVYEANRAICDIIISYLNKINETLRGTPFKIAYRARNEFILYVLASLQYEGHDTCYKLIRALDEMTLMKVLSRIEGDKNKLMNLQQTGCILEDLAVQIKSSLEDIYENFDALEGEKSMYANWEEETVSLRKLKEMKRKLDNTYYCSFWS